MFAFRQAERSQRSSLGLRSSLLDYCVTDFSRSRRSWIRSSIPGWVESMDTEASRPFRPPSRLRISLNGFVPNPCSIIRKPAVWSASRSKDLEYPSSTRSVGMAAACDKMLINHAGVGIFQRAAIDPRFSGLPGVVPPEEVPLLHRALPPWGAA